jgi:hypothetical protein
MRLRCPWSRRFNRIKSRMVLGKQIPRGYRIQGNQCATFASADIKKQLWKDGVRIIPSKEKLLRYSHTESRMPHRPQRAHLLDPGKGADLL